MSQRKGENQLVEFIKNKKKKPATIEQRQEIHEFQYEANLEDEGNISLISTEISGVLPWVIALIILGWTGLTDQLSYEFLISMVICSLVTYYPVKKIVQRLYTSNQTNILKKALKQNFQDRKLSSEKASEYIVQLKNSIKPRYHFHSIIAKSIYISSMIYSSSRHYVRPLLIFIPDKIRAPFFIIFFGVFTSLTSRKMIHAISYIKNYLLKKFNYTFVSEENIRKIFQEISKNLERNKRIGIQSSEFSRENENKISMFEIFLFRDRQDRDLLFLELSLSKNKKNASSKEILERYLWEIAITQILSEQHFEVASADENQFLVTLNKKIKASNIKLDAIKINLLDASRKISQTINFCLKLHSALTWMTEKIPNGYWKLIFVSGKKLNDEYSLDLKFTINNDLNEKSETPKGAFRNLKESLKQIDFFKDKINIMDKSITIQNINTISKIPTAFYKYTAKEIKNSISGSISSDSTLIPSFEDLKDIEFHDNGGLSWFFPQKIKIASPVKNKIKTRGTPTSKKMLPLAPSSFPTSSNTLKYIDFILDEEQKRAKKKHFNPLDKGKNNESKTKFIYLDKNSKKIKEMKRDHPIQYKQLKSTTLEAESIGVNSENIKGTKWIKNKNICEIKLAGNSARFWGKIYKAKFKGRDIKIAHITRGNISHKKTERILRK